MMKCAPKIRDAIVRWKFRIGYLSGFLTTFAAVIIITNTVQDKSKLVGLSISYVTVLIIVSIGVILGAYILDKFGFIESELSYANTKNKLLKDVYDKK